MWNEVAQTIKKIPNFWYKFVRKGYIPLSDYYKIWHGGGNFRSAPSRQILALYVWKCEPQAAKVAKIAIFLL